MSQKSEVVVRAAGGGIRRATRRHHSAEEKIRKRGCTPMKLKRLKRWEHDGVLDKMQAALDRMPDGMTIRRQKFSPRPRAKASK